MRRSGRPDLVTFLIEAALRLELDDKGAFEVPGDRHVERTSIIARKQELAVTRDGALRAADFYSCLYIDLRASKRVVALSCGRKRAGVALRARTCPDP